MLTCLCRENAELRIRSAVDQGRRDPGARGGGADGLRRLWRRADLSHHHDCAYAARQLPARRGEAGQPRGLHQYRAQRRLPRLQRRLQHLRARTAHRRDRRPPSAWIPWSSAAATFWETATSARPGRSSRATSSGPCSTAWRRSALRGRPASPPRATGSMAAPRPSARGSCSSAPRRRRSISTPTAAPLSSPPASRSAPARWCRRCRRSSRPSSACVPRMSSCGTADTDAAGYDVGVGGGRTTVSLGAASRAAAIEVRGKLLRRRRRNAADAAGKAGVARGPSRDRRRQGIGSDDRRGRAARAGASGPLGGLGRVHRTRLWPRSRAARAVISSTRWRSRCSPSTIASWRSIRRPGTSRC